MQRKYIKKIGHQPPSPLSNLTRFFNRIFLFYSRFSLYFQPIKKPKKLKMPKGAGLTKPMKLSADLADIVGKKEASRAECIKQLWAYIKKNNLQDPENKQFFNPDKKMAKV